MLFRYRATLHTTALTTSGTDTARRAVVGIAERTLAAVFEESGVKTTHAAPIPEDPRHKAARAGRHVRAFPQGTSDSSSHTQSHEKMEAITNENTRVKMVRRGGLEPPRDCSR